MNGELRQDGCLSDLIVDVPGLIGHASTAMPFMPGDVYTTGTPAGTSPIDVSDEVVVQCEPFARMRLPVRRRAW